MSTNASAAPAADDASGLPADMVTDDPRANGNAAGPEVEGFAKRLGWKPQDEFNGPKERWQDAEAFLKRAQEELPSARARLKFQDEFIRKMQTDLSATQKAAADAGSALKELLERDNKREERGFSFARQQIEARMDQAAKDADWDTYTRAKADLADLDKLKPAAKAPEKKPEDDKAPTQQQNDPVVAAWLRDNAWFNTDAKLRRAATAYEAGLHVDEPNLLVAERLQKTTEEIKRLYPDKFENPARKQQSAVNSPTGQGVRQTQKKEKTVADLPAEDRAVMDRLVRQKVLTKEQYLKDYKWTA
jgi:hypothetical protein